jgi:hypothetical protein
MIVMLLPMMGSVVSMSVAVTNLGFFHHRIIHSMLDFQFHRFAFFR